MKQTKNDTDLLDDFTEEQLAELVKSNEALDQELESMSREMKREERRKLFDFNKSNRNFYRLSRSPLEIINRTLLFLFLGSFLFSFYSAYTISPLWFVFYIMSAFSCILYAPNRKALKELLAAWPNLEDIIRKRSV